MSLKDVSIKKSKSLLKDEEALEKEPNGSFAWKVLPPSQVRSLLQCETPEDLQTKMATVMELEEHETELKEACVLDFYVTAFHWAKEKNFDERQLSGFVTLLSNLLGNIKDQHMNKSENLKYLKECFSCVGFENPNIVSVSLYFFKLDHAKIVTQYLISTLFYHYSLYEYLFTKQQDELIIGSDHCVEACPETLGPFPPPLEEGMLVETYEEFVVQHNAKKAEKGVEAENRLITGEFTDGVVEALQSTNADAVAAIPANDLRKIIERIAKEMIIPVKTDFQNKIKNKETAFLERINKIHIK